MIDVITYLYGITGELVWKHISQKMLQCEQRAWFFGYVVFVIVIHSSFMIRICIIVFRLEYTRRPLFSVKCSISLKTFDHCPCSIERIYVRMISTGHTVFKLRIKDPMGIFIDSDLATLLRGPGSDGSLLQSKSCADWQQRYLPRYSVACSQRTAPWDRNKWPPFYKWQSQMYSSMKTVMLRFESQSNLSPHDNAEPLVRIMPWRRIGDMP